MHRSSDEQLLLGSFKYIKQKDFWIKRLAPPMAKTGIPLARQSGGSEGHSPGAVEIDLPPGLCSRILHLANHTDLTIYILLAAGLMALIYRYSGNEDLTVISPVYQRGNTQTLLNDFLFVRGMVHRELTFKELLLQLKNSVLEAYENQDYPFDRLLESLLGNGPPVTRGNNGISTIQCSLENIHGPGEIRGIPGFLDFSFKREGQRLQGEIRYRTDGIERDYIRQISGHFTGILESASRDLDARVSALSFLTAAETRRLLFDFNDNKAAIPGDQTVCTFLETRAGQQPHRVALGFAAEQVTYGVLNRAAHGLAVELRTRGMGRDRTAGIMLHRSPLFTAVILAVWKAGGAYIPLDPAYPATRITTILEDSAAKVLITSSTLASTWRQEKSGASLMTVSPQPLEDPDPDLPNPGPPPGMNHLAYVIYTSGSTGKPKGAMVEHMGMMNHLHAKIRELHLSGESVVAQNAAITFDISLWQFFVALIPGGKTTIYPDRILLEPQRFLNRLRQDRVTVLEVVPSYLSALLESIALQSSLPPLALEYLLVTGEELKAHLVNRWFAAYPGIKLVNAYGPTEASDDITHFILDSAAVEQLHSIPIGKPLQNFDIFILDENLQLSPPGVKGEICAAGIGVGRGYLNNPESTAERFPVSYNRSYGSYGSYFFKGKPSPSHLTLNTKHSTLYKTGDLGRWLPDGNIEFLGRIDYQVKIRGFRIELGEIENVLLKAEGIRDAVVEARVDGKGNKYLCAYFVARGKLSIPRLNGYLAAHLPAYMVPTYLVELAKFPFTANGKIDRKALPEPDLTVKTMRYIPEKMLKEAMEKQDQYEPDDPALLPADERTGINRYSQRSGKGCVPLNHSQEMVYTIEKTYPGTNCENDGYIVKYPGALDGDLLQQAIHRVISQNENLRTRILEIETEDFIGPAQYISPYQAQPLDYVDFSGQDGENRLEKWVRENTDQPFHLIDHDLFYFARLKFGAHSCGYYLKSHHIVSDGASYSLIFKEIDETYLALKAGKTPTPTHPSPSHFQYQEDEQAYLESPRARADRDFWLKYLLPLPGEFSLSARRENTANMANIAGDSRKLVFTPHLRQKMHDYCRNRGVSLYKLILAALAVYIAHLTRREEFIVSTINHGRHHESHGKMKGMFINFIPLKIKIPGTLDFHSFLEGLGRQVNDILKNHSRYPSGRIAADIGKVTGADTRCLWYLTLIGHPDEAKGNFRIEHFASGHEATPLVIHINCSNKDIDGILELEWVYQLEHFSAADITDLHQGLAKVLTHVANHPETPIREMEFLVGAPLPQPAGNKADTLRVERLLQAHEDIETAAVVERKEKNGETYGCAFVVSAAMPDEAGLKTYLARQLPASQVPSCFIRLEKMPLTANGEIRRNLLRTLDIDIAGEFNPPPDPLDDTETRVAGIWQEVLGIEKSKIGSEANFFALGGHSLKAVVLAARLHKEFNVKVALPLLFDHPTLRGTAKIIKQQTRQAGSSYVSIALSEKKEYYPLSSAQKRLFILQRFEPNLTHYNIPVMVKLIGRLGLEAMETAFKQLLQRHESLRTSFAIINGEPVQQIHKPVEFSIDYYRWNQEEIQREPKEKRINEVAADFIRPFNLSHAPLIRVRIIKEEETLHLLVVDLHHIISDGVSQQILVRDFMEFYRQRELAALKLQYRDYSLWQQHVASESFRQQEHYWKRQLAGEIPLLNLPTDFPRPPVLEFAGNVEGFELSARETETLNRLARSAGATLFMALLSVYAVFLSRLSGQEDIVIGTPTAGRTHADLEHIVGMFVNTLALRFYPAGEKSFNAFLNEVKEKTVAAFENQGYQFEDLVETAALRRDISRSPLFDTMFTLHNAAASPGKTIRQSSQNGLEMEPYPQQHVNAKFDFSLAAAENGEILYLTCEYRTRLFKKETILGFITYFQQILSSILADPGKRLRRLEILPAEEKKRILINFNDNALPYPGDKTIPQLFARQAEQTPDQVVLVGSKAGSEKESRGEADRVHLAYRELHEKSHHLAYELIRKGVLPGTLIGIMMERSVELIIGFLGILKAGGAYLPLDPEYPQDRIAYMLKDSSASLIVTSFNLTEGEKVSRWEGEVFNIDELLNSSYPLTVLPSYLRNSSILATGHRPPATTLAYLIYTSGSSGRPKGVLIQHNSVVSLVKGSNYICWKPGARLLLTGSIAFDITTFEIWAPLLNGYPLYLVNQEVILEGKQLNRFLVNHRITILHLVPQLFNQLAAHYPGIFAGLDYFLVGGDLVRPYWINRIRGMYGDLKILHMYGPTENTTFSTFHPVEQDYESVIPIGKPISNTTIYILDRYANLVPLGVTGTLAVGGPGLARGYLNQPELTAKKFGQNKTLLRGVQGGSFLEKSPPGRRRQKFYKTGDLARWLPGEIIEFLGREDTQVKVRGIRIELAEIETRLAAHGDIKEAVVVDREKDSGEKYLCAYFTSRRDIPVSELRKYLARELPEPMIPAYFTAMEQLPLTPVGKIHRQSLPPPGESRPALETTYTAPRGHLETTIAQTWKEVLHLDRVGIQDNFFDLGGNSLSLVKVNAQLQTALGQDIPLVKMFRYPTIDTLARYIHQEAGEPLEVENPEEAASQMEEAMHLLSGDQNE